MAMMKMVDMAMIRAVARCPWPESSAEVGERRQRGRAQALLQAPTHQQGPFSFPAPKTMALPLGLLPGTLRV